MFSEIYVETAVMSQKSFISKNSFQELETPKEIMEDSSMDELRGVKIEITVAFIKHLTHFYK